MSYLVCFGGSCPLADKELIAWAVNLWIILHCDVILQLCFDLGFGVICKDMSDWGSKVNLAI